MKAKHKKIQAMVYFGIMLTALAYCVGYLLLNLSLLTLGVVSGALMMPAIVAGAISGVFAGLYFSVKSKHKLF